MVLVSSMTPLFVLLIRSLPFVNSSFIYFQAAVGGYGFALFLPIILEESLNFTQERSFLLSTPPTIFGVAVSITISYISDHTHIRGPYVFALCFPAIIGLCMITYLQNSWARYVGAFVGLAGYLSMAPAMLAWQANNIRGIAKKSVATAIIIMASGVSGIYTSLVFRQQVCSSISLFLAIGSESGIRGS